MEILFSFLSFSRETNALTLTGVKWVGGGGGGDLEDGGGAMFDFGVSFCCGIFGLVQLSGCHGHISIYVGFLFYFILIFLIIIFLRFGLCLLCSCSVFACALCFGLFLFSFIFLCLNFCRVVIMVMDHRGGKLVSTRCQTKLKLVACIQKDKIIISLI